MNGSFESMESPMLEIQNLRTAFREHSEIIAKQDAEIEQLKQRVAFMASNDYVHSLTSLLRDAHITLKLFVDMADPQGTEAPSARALIERIRKEAQ
jgi:hypothetical protein